MINRTRCSEEFVNSDADHIHNKFNKDVLPHAFIVQQISPYLNKPKQKKVLQNIQQKYQTYQLIFQTASGTKIVELKTLGKVVSYDGMKANKILYENVTETSQIKKENVS